MAATLDLSLPIAPEPLPLPPHLFHSNSVSEAPTSSSFLEPQPSALHKSVSAADSHLGLHSAVVSVKGPSGFTTDPRLYAAVPTAPPALSLQRMGSFDLPIVPPTLPSGERSRHSFLETTPLNPLGGFLEPGALWPSLRSQVSSTMAPPPPSLAPSTSYTDAAGPPIRLARDLSTASTQSLLEAIPDIPGPLQPAGPPRGEGGVLPLFSRSRSQVLTPPDSPPPTLAPSFGRSVSAPGAMTVVAAVVGPEGGVGPIRRALCALSGNVDVAPQVSLEDMFEGLDVVARSEYRRQSLQRWLEKRKRRRSERVVQYTERSLLANKRLRVGGRFVRTSSLFVSVTDLQRGEKGPSAPSPQSSSSSSSSVVAKPPLPRKGAGRPQPTKSSSSPSQRGEGRPQRGRRRRTYSDEESSDEYVGEESDDDEDDD